MSAAHSTLSMLLMFALVAHVDATTHARSDALHGIRAQPSSNDALRQQYKELIEPLDRGGEGSLRTRIDSARERLWVLGYDYVYVYSARTRALIRKIKLPGWGVADAICPPDLVLDRKGTAFVSSNVQPRLLQIGPDRFETTEHHIKLLSAEGWDVGFGALAFGSDGSLIGLTALAGTLWKIDLGRRTAQRIGVRAPPADTCSLGRDRAAPIASGQLYSRGSGGATPPGSGSRATLITMDISV